MLFSSLFSHRAAAGRPERHAAGSRRTLGRSSRGRLARLEPLEPRTMLDGGTLAMIALEPAGSLIYKGTAEGTFGGDDDTYALHVDVNQPLALRVMSTVDSTLTLEHSVSGPIALPADLDPGADRLYQPLTFGTAGIVTITIAGTDAGYYKIEAALNAQFDNTQFEEGENGPLIAQSLVPSTIVLGQISRGAVIGSLEGPVDRISTETGDNDLSGSWDWARSAPGEYAGWDVWSINNGQGVTGSLSSKNTFDYWWFRVRAGDQFTIRAHGKGTEGCTLNKTILTTWDSNNKAKTGDPVPGSPSDSILEGSLSATGYCLVMVSTVAGSKGTYKLTVDLTTPTNPQPNGTDVYTVDTVEGQYIAVAAATGGDTVDQPKVQLALTGPGIDAPISSGKSGALDGLIEYGPVAAGTYTIAVTPGPGLLTASTEYTLVAVGNGLFDNGTNTSFALAQDLPVGSGALGAITTSTGTFVSSGSGGLKGATGIDFGPADKLFVASVNSDEVMRYQGPFDPSPGAPDGISTSRKSPPAVFVKAGLGGLDAPEWLQFGPDGNLYVVSSTKNQVFRYNGTTGASMGVFVTTSDHGLYSPTGLLFGQDRNLYVAGTRDDGGGIVQCYDRNDGSLVNTLDRNHLGGLLSPQGLTLGPDYNDDGLHDLYVSSGGTDEVLRYERYTNTFVPFVNAGSGGLDEPTGLAFGPDGNLYVSSLSTNEVLRYDGANGQFIDAYVAARGGGLVRPGDLAWGPDDNLYVTVQDQSIVYRVSAAADFYKVTLSENHTYTFSTSTPESARGQLDPHIELYNAPSLQSRVAYGTDSADGRNEEMSYSVLSGAGGEYYIKVSGGSKSISGDYVLNPIVEVSSTSSQPTAVSQPTDYAALAAAAVYGNNVSRASAADQIFSGFGTTARKNRFDGLAVDLVDIDYLFSK